jgi:hypothetical protein
MQLFGRKAIWLLGAGALLVLYLRRDGVAAEELDPLKVASDTHKLVFENQFVRVLEVNVPPGKVEPFHRHNRRVIVDLNDWSSRSTERGAAPKEAQRKAGTVRWSDAVIHTVENTGKTAGHAFSIELR